MLRRSNGWHTSSDFRLASWRETVATYNEAVSSGSDPFGRSAMPKAIDTASFYEIRSRGTLALTMAGVRIDPSARVLDARGHPVPALYAAGEVVGGGQLQGWGLLRRDDEHLVDHAGARGSYPAGIDPAGSNARIRHVTCCTGSASGEWSTLTWAAQLPMISS